MCVCCVVKTVTLSHVACYEAYISDNGAAYACSIGCGVSVQTVIDDEIAQISTMNNLMDVLFVSRVVDMLSYDGEPRGDARGVWGDEVDVYLSEVNIMCVKTCRYTRGANVITLRLYLNDNLTCM